MDNYIPGDLYQKINPDDWRRIFLVGDLHGCYDQLLDKLEKFAFDTDRDLLISVGDLIDRGKQSLGCLGLLGQKWFCAVRGNHEQMAMEAVESNDYDLWLINGGGWFFRLEDRQQQQAKTLIAACARLPLVIDIELKKQHFVIVHADYPQDHYAFDQPVDATQLVWSRRRIERNQKGRGAAITGATHFFFGHTPLDRVRHYYNQFYIDTGAVFGGTLTLVELTNLPV